MQVTVQSNIHILMGIRHNISQLLPNKNYKISDQWTTKISYTSTV